MARLLADATTDKIDFLGRGAPILYNQTLGTVLGWFKRPSIASAFRGIFLQEAASNKVVRIQLSNTGLINVAWRTPTAAAAFDSGSAYDDDIWHRFAFFRNDSSPYSSLFVDGVADGDSGADADPTTDATAPTLEFWGNNSGAIKSLGGEMARCAFWAGTRLSLAEAEAFLKGDGTQLHRPPDLWHEMRGDPVEPDWSGNGRYGTLTGTSPAPHGAIRQVRDPRIPDRVR
ncbi:hypothetical protein LCGC14_2467470, partial [marine sediment metagenome]